MQDASATTVFSHYRILSRLGAGGMGEVWLAEDTRLERKVALKILPAEFTQDAERMRRFMQEAKAASALNHPNIITVYDIGECEAGRFIVMELVAGRTLRTVIAEDNKVETLLTLGSQMAKALAAAHNAGITHRDIKPDNIMVREDGYVKVLDFGLARLLPSASGEDAATLAQQTVPGMLMGTVAYMSPEQASGQRAGPASDIFSLGIVLYELVTGQHPFNADTLVGYLHAITLQTPTPPSQSRPELPAALNELIMRMLEKDAGRRPTATEVVQALLDMERRGETKKPQHCEVDTMVLPINPAGVTRADEGFWVAVLPFKYRGANADLEALAEGLSEDIVTGLSRFSYIRVISRSSTLRFSSEASDIRAIGKELGARYVMEGSIRQAGATVRLAVQLVDATTGAHLWAEMFDRHFQPDQIFAIQDELIPRIVSTCADRFGVLARSISDAVRWKDPSQLSPYEALMRGFGYHHRLNPSEHAEAREVLERAVEQAPGNADCWAMLSWVYSHEYGHGFNPRPGSLDRALTAARRAVDLAPSNHLTYQTLATALFFRKDVAGCLSAVERAMALNPLDASNDVIFLIAFTGDWERGCSLISRRMELNPHHPGWYELVLAINEYRKANYQGALDTVVKANVPGIFWTHIVLAATYGQLGEDEAARGALRNLLAEKEDFGGTGREALGKWFDAALVEHLMDGLRKAGLEITGDESVSTRSSVIDVTDKRNFPGTNDRPAIAVLPFSNLSADSDQEFFCDGLAEELLNALSKINALRVAARTSSFSFKGKETDIREIGPKLNVSAVLEGSVRKSGNRLRITAQLINVADGYHLWSERYDRELQDVFDIQDEITLAIVEALKVKLLGAEMAAVTKRYTDNTEAYQLYLLGRFHYSKYTEEGYRKSIEYYEQAIAIEPDYAPAFASVAMSYLGLWYYGHVAPDQSIAKMRAAANRALALDQSLPESHYALADLMGWHDWDWSGAEREFKQALALNPNYAEAHEQYGVLLSLTGQPDPALAEAARALELAPLSLQTNLNVGWTFWFAGQPERMLEQGCKLIELEPNFFGGHWLMETMFWLEGNYEQALTPAESAVALGGGPQALAFLGCLYGITGKREQAEHVLDKLQPSSGQRYAPRFDSALIYAGLGEWDRAFELFEEAYEQREGVLVCLKKIAELIPGFSDDPRLADLLRRIGLE